MNETEFTYWLKGFFELSETNHLTEKQVMIIKDHLNLVFNKVTPDRKTSSPASILKEELEKTKEAEAKRKQKEFFEKVKREVSKEKNLPKEKSSVMKDSTKYCGAYSLGLKKMC